MALSVESVRSLLEDGMEALLLATADGLVIDAAARPGTSLEFDNLAAEVAGIFRAATLIGRGVAASPVVTLTLTMENGRMVLALPIAGEAIGVLIPQPATSYRDGLKALERVRLSLHQILEVQTGRKLVDAMARMSAFDTEPAPAPASAPGRVALKGVETTAVGTVATVRVHLGLGRRTAAAKTVGRDQPGQRARLAGEATIRALLELLPPGHAVELTHLEATTPAREALWALTRFLSPEAEQSLFGIAPVQDGDEALAAAKAILNAVNRRIEILLAAPAS